MRSLSTIPITAAARTCRTSPITAPVFYQGRLVAFVANIAHHSDVGGKVPGSESSDCTSIFQEGLRLPPVRVLSEGVVNDDILSIILLNSAPA